MTMMTTTTTNTSTAVDPNRVGDNKNNITNVETLRTEDLLVVSIWSSLLTYGFITNLMTLAGIIRNRHMRQSTSYWLVISLALCDVLMIIVSLAHLIPATLFHDYFVPVNDFRNIFAIFVYNVFWYSGVIQLGGMAMNRFVSIVYPVKYRRMFSRQNTAIILAILWALGIAASLPALFPCCYTIYDHNIWLTAFVDENSLYYIVDLGLNTVSLSVMIFCYAAILWKVRKSQVSTRRHRTTAGCNNSPYNRQSQRSQLNSREMKLFIQFFVVSLVFLLTFLTWQWLLRLPDASKWIYFTTTTFFFINNAVNPTVYLIYNSGLRREVRAMFCWWIKEKQPQQTPSSDDQKQNPEATTVAPTSRMEVDSERTALAP